MTLPGDIIHVPIIQYTKKKSRKGKDGKTAVVTSSPYIKELSTHEENRQLKEWMKEMQKEMEELKKRLRNENETWCHEEHDQYTPGLSKATSKKAKRTIDFIDCDDG